MVLASKNSALDLKAPDFPETLIEVVMTFAPLPLKLIRAAQATAYLPMSYNLCIVREKETREPALAFRLAARPGPKFHDAATLLQSGVFPPIGPASLGDR
jgi:hypothetical protein